MRITELAEKVAGELTGRGDIEIRGVAGIGEAQDGDITFVTDEKRFQDLAECRASAVIVPRGAPQLPIPSSTVKNPRYVFAQVLRIFHERLHAPGGIIERAVIGKDVVMGAGPTIHPFAVVSDGVKIGSRVTLYPGVFVGTGSSIGDDTVIYPNVSIREGVAIGSRVIIHSGTVIGSDGFGFVTEGGLHHKILQIGGVIIEDDVEIGANCTIDRAALGMTRIKKGTKLDNMVHVAEARIARRVLGSQPAGVLHRVRAGDAVAANHDAGGEAREGPGAACANG